MHTAHSSARVWAAVSLLFLLLALFAYGGNEQGWMTNAVAVPLALVGVVGFTAATLAAALRRSSRL